MENTPEVLRYTAFSTTPDGGNPAGLVLDARHLDDAGMLVRHARRHRAVSLAHRGRTSSRRRRRIHGPNCRRRPCSDR